MKIAVLLLKYIDSLHSSFSDRITCCELTIYSHYLSFSRFNIMIKLLFFVIEILDIFFMDKNREQKFLKNTLHHNYSSKNLIRKTTRCALKKVTSEMVMNQISQLIS